MFNVSEIMSTSIPPTIFFTTKQPTLALSPTIKSQESSLDFGLQIYIFFAVLIGCIACFLLYYVRQSTQLRKLLHKHTIELAELQTVRTMSMSVQTPDTCTTTPKDILIVTTDSPSTISNGISNNILLKTTTPPLQPPPPPPPPRFRPYSMQNHPNCPPQTQHPPPRQKYSGLIYAKGAPVMQSQCPQRSNSLPVQNQMRPVQIITHQQNGINAQQHMRQLQQSQNNACLMDTKDTTYESGDSTSDSTTESSDNSNTLSDVSSSSSSSSSYHTMTDSKSSDSSTNNNDQPPSPKQQSVRVIKMDVEPLQQAEKITLDGGGKYLKQQKNLGVVSTTKNI